MLGHSLTCLFVSCWFVLDISGIRLDENNRTIVTSTKVARRVPFVSKLNYFLLRGLLLSGRAHCRVSNEILGSQLSYTLVISWIGHSGPKRWKLIKIVFWVQIRSKWSPRGPFWSIFLVIRPTVSIFEPFHTQKSSLDTPRGTPCLFLLNQ